MSKRKHAPAARNTCTICVESFLEHADVVVPDCPCCKPMCCGCFYRRMDETGVATCSSCAGTITKIVRTRDVLNTKGRHGNIPTKTLTETLDIFPRPSLPASAIEYDELSEEDQENAVNICIKFKGTGEEDKTMLDETLHASSCTTSSEQRGMVAVICVLLHGLFVKAEAKLPLPKADSTASLLRAAHGDRSLTHIAVHALATGEHSLPDVEGLAVSEHKRLLVPFACAEMIKKLSNCKKVDALLGFMAKVADSAAPSQLKHILCDLGMSASYENLRRQRGEALLLAPDVTEKLEGSSIHLVNTDNVHFNNPGKTVTQTCHLSYTEVPSDEIRAKGLYSESRAPKYVGTPMG